MYNKLVSLFAATVNSTDARITVSVGLAMVPVSLLLFTSGYLFEQEASADTLMPIDGFTCGPNFRGSWDAGTNTCTLGTPKLPAGTDIEIEQGITAVIPNGATLNLNGGTIDNHGTLKVLGLLGVKGPGNIINSGTLVVGDSQIFADGPVIAISGSIDNSGTITVRGRSNYGILHQGAIINSGSISVRTSGEYGIYLKQGSSLQNTGTISVLNTAQTGLRISYSDSVINNYGTVTVGTTKNISSAVNGSVGNYGTINNYGTITVNTNGKIANVNKLIVFCGASLYLNGGTITVKPVIYESPCYTLPSTKLSAQHVLPKIQEVNDPEPKSRL